MTFKNYRNLEDDLTFFYGDDVDNLGKNKIKKIIAYNIQTYDILEDALAYLRYVVARDAVIFDLYDRENKYSIFYLLSDILNFLKEVSFPLQKEWLKSEIVKHLQAIEDDFERYILVPDQKITKRLNDCLKLYLPKEIVEKNDADSLKEELYTITETAKILKVTTQTIYNYITEGKIKAIRLSAKKQRISKSEISKFLRQ